MYLLQKFLNSCNSFRTVGRYKKESGARTALASKMPQFPTYDHSHYKEGYRVYYEDTKEPWKSYTVCSLLVGCVVQDGLAYEFTVKDVHGPTWNRGGVGCRLIK